MDFTKEEWQDISGVYKRVVVSSGEHINFLSQYLFGKLEIG